MIDVLRLRRLSLASAQQWASSLAAACAFCAVAAGGELALPIAIAFPLALGFSVAFGDRVAGKYQWAWTAALVLAVVIELVLVVLGREDPVLAAAQFSVLLCMHRLWHRRNERDEYLLLLLSLLMVCAGAALSAELLFGVSFVAYAICATWALALTHLRFEVERRSEAPRRNVLAPSLLARLAALAVLGLAGTTLLFVGFPRMAFGGLRRHPAASRAVAGLSDQITLSGHGTIADDPRVVLRVQAAKDEDGMKLVGMHWRARSFDVWTGNGWRSRSDLGRRRVLSEAPPMRRDPDWRAKRADVQSFEVEAVAGFSDGVILTPEGWPVSAFFPHGFGGRAPRVFRTPSGDFLYTPLQASDVRYVVNVDRTMANHAELRGRGRDYPPEVAVDLVVPPNLDPRVQALSSRLTARKDPVDAAASVETWLSNALAYSRDLSGESQDPIANFLFRTKKGHCELFSSAMVILLRAAGIPARNVTGYYGGTETDSGYVAIRAGDAHSWVEVYFPGAGFVPFDPTPSAGRGARTEGLWPRAVLAWDSLAQRWSRFVIDYDLVAQSRVLSSVGKGLSRIGDRLRGKQGAATAFQWALPAGIAAVLLAAGAFYAARRKRRAGTHGRTLSGDEARARSLWLAARHRLERSHVAVAPSAGVREAVERIALHVPRARGPVEKIAEAVLAARWGGRPLERREARALLESLDAALR
ncbi:MAG: transglutaminase domain-containing protein [Deltaproteobacteria bacterium]|nr:MAG: transglutaminase domain-containing protein [Deltaproteobacteria bacterium]